MVFEVVEKATAKTFAAKIYSTKDEEKLDLVKKKKNLNKFEFNL